MSEADRENRFVVPLDPEKVSRLAGRFRELADMAQDEITSRELQDQARELDAQADRFRSRSTSSS